MVNFDLIYYHHYCMIIQCLSRLGATSHPMLYYTNTLKIHQGTLQKLFFSKHIHIHIHIISMKSFRVVHFFLHTFSISLQTKAPSKFQAVAANRPRAAAVRRGRGSCRKKIVVSRGTLRKHEFRKE